MTLMECHPPGSKAMMGTHWRGKPKGRFLQNALALPVPSPDCCYCVLTVFGMV